MNADPLHFLSTTRSSLGEDDILVTLTFAQSCDGKIAGKDGEQLLLSGKESMLMTHRMRSLHDGILVGIGTALNDNPQLNTRLLPPENQSESPRPIVLDCKMRLLPGCKLLRNFRAGKGKQPLLVTKLVTEDSEGYSEWKMRRNQLEAQGAEIIEVAEERDGILSIPHLLKRLRNLNITSLMVEGGATVISSFLMSGLVDFLVVTVAPVMIGDQGVGYRALVNEQTTRLDFVSSTLLAGRDSVIVWKLVKLQSKR